MKLKMVLCVMVVILVLPLVSIAESIKMKPTIIEMNPSEVELMPTYETPAYEKKGYSSCYVPVTYKTVVGDVVTNEVTYYEKVADIEFLYYISINSRNECVGGYIVTTRGWPKIMEESVTHLELNINQTESPTGYVIPTDNGAKYTVNIYGGCIEITYNNVIYKDINNQMFDADSDTVTRVYSFSQTLETEK